MEQDHYPEIEVNVTLLTSICKVFPILFVTLIFESAIPHPLILDAKGEKTFIREHNEDLLSDIRTKVLTKLFKPYARIQIQFISGELNMRWEEWRACLSVASWTAPL